MRLRYGCNPHQAFATAEPFGDEGPFRVLNGSPSLINVLDVLNAWQCVLELRSVAGLPAAASFKHVSPAGVAVATPLTERLATAYECDGAELTPAATAYVRARGTDPKSSYGDMIALSDPVDEATARLVAAVVSDGIVAPSYAPEALKILVRKKRGSFLVVQADAEYEPPARETREVFGIRLTQDRNSRRITAADLSQVVCGEMTPEAQRDALVGLVALAYTQSNSVAYVLDGQTIGIGAGQQSRIDCTKLAGAKADVWHLRRHPKVLGLRFEQGVKRQDRVNWRVRYIEGDLTRGEEAAFRAALLDAAEPLTESDRREWMSRLSDVTFVSDGLLPFRDNIDHAARHGVCFVVQPGGAARDNEIDAACREHGIAMVHTGLRLFHH